MKPKRAKPIYAFAVSRGGEIDIDSIDLSRDAIVRRLNRPAGESVVPVRISQVGRHPKDDHDFPRAARERT
jgi:hypothetical protein